MLARSWYLHRKLIVAFVQPTDPCLHTDCQLTRVACSKRTMTNAAKKRIFDLVVTILGTVIWVPLLLTCIAAIAVVTGRPIFYVSQRRVGERTIPVVKFRTMRRDADRFYNRHTVPVSNNVRFLNTPPDSPLYTSVGRVIERCAITEIPQFLHVLRGDMSLIGNRPLPENVIESIAEVFPNVRERFRTPAGMTGPVQLVGRSEISDADRLLLETTYCRVVGEGYSWRLDFWILLFTVLISQRIMQPFTVGDLLRFMEGYRVARP